MIKLSIFFQTTQTDNNLSPEVVAQIRSINKLDIELYEHARKLLLTRFDAAKVLDSTFQEHFDHTANKIFNFHDIQAPEEEEDYD